MSRRLPRVGSLAAAVAALALGAAPAVAQQCGMPYREVVSAMYAQVLESGGHPANLDYWEWQMQNGVTVRQMVHDHAQWGLDGQPFLTAQSDSMKLTYLYRHILAREPDDHAWGWIGVGQVHGWHHVVSGLVNSAEYSSRFGDYIVPGSPVTAWDCARAAGITAVAHAHDYVDATMGAANLGYTTPAYVSLDQPRSLTFAYSSGTARPQGLVRVNVFDPHAPPERISIQLYETDGTQITGETFYQGGPGVTQVSSHFDADAKYSAAWSVRVAIRRYYASNPTPVEAVFDTRVSIVNERDSPFGRGWTLAGYPRLRNQGDGVFITESGLGAWFWLQGSDSNGDRRYASPQGDFSKVTWHQASGTYRRRYPDGTVVRFGWDGLVLDVTDRHGNLIAYSHNGSQLTKVVDPVGKTTTLGYNGAGALAWVEDPMGRRSNTTTNGNVVWQWWQPDGSWALDMHFVDGGARSPVLDSYWTPGGSRDEGLHTAWSFSYDAHGRVSAVQSPAVAITEAGVGDEVPMRTVGQSRSLEMALLPPSGTGGVGAPAPRVQPHEVRVSTTDARGNIRYSAVDPWGNATRVEEPLGRVTQATYAPGGRAVRAVGTRGEVSRSEYVGVEMRRNINETLGQTTVMEYEPVFHQLTHSSGGGTTAIWNEYDLQDPARKLATTRSGTSNAPPTSFGYTSRGRVASITDPEGHGTFLSYGDQTGGNNHGNLHRIGVGMADGSYRRMTTRRHDRYGRDSVIKNPEGDSTRTVYDLLNRVRQTYNALGGTSYEYYRGMLWAVRDPKGQSYFFHHDAMGRLRSQRDPRLQYTYYRYDRTGNVASLTNRRGQTTLYAYDALGRRESLSASDGVSTQWSYDPHGWWAVSRNAVGSDSTVFDVAGRVVSTTTRRGDRVYSQTHTHNAEGQRTAVTIEGPWPGARSVGYGYRADQRLGTLTDFGGAASTLGYNDDGALTSADMPGTARSYNYSSIHTPTSVNGHEYSYTQNGQVDQWRVAGTWDLRKYTYDRLGRLGSASDYRYETQPPYCFIDAEGMNTCVAPLEPVLKGSTTYTYDENGNPLGDGALLGMGNRLEEYRGFVLEYDADGNLTQKNSTDGSHQQSMTWNSLGQMTSITVNGNTVEYGYDALGRWAYRHHPGVSYNEYVHDGDHLILERDAAGNVVEYTYMPGVDQPHSMTKNGQTYYYVQDHPGNVTEVRDAAGTVLNRYRYTPWGERLASTFEGVGNPFQFAARHYEPAGGIYRARARWYDPQLRRFMSEDPIGLSGGLNPYTYADNDPINKTDPMGLCSYVGSRSNPIAGKPCNPCPSDWTRGADGRCRSGRGESDVPCPPGICANEKERVIPPHHSSCNQAAVPCDLYKPNEDQWNQIRDILLNEVDVAKSDFCAALQLSGLAMIHNQVALYNNDARWVVDNPKRHDYVYGEAPELIRGRSARGMYIKIPITVLKVMHEAIHGVYQQGTRWPRTYGDGGPVEINDMAKGCMRGRR